MLQIWFLYFWPKEETSTVFVFKLVEVSLSSLHGVRGSLFICLFVCLFIFHSSLQDQGIDNPGKEN